MRKEEDPPMETWMVQIDGSTTKKVGEVGVVLISPEKEKLKYTAKLQFPATNNEAEYEALLIRLSLVKALGAKNLIVCRGLFWWDWAASCDNGLGCLLR